MPKKLFQRYSLTIFILVLWETIVKLGWVDQTFLPSLEDCVEAIYTLSVKSFLFTHIMVTLVRVITGLFLAVIIAVPLAYVMGRLLPEFFQRTESLLRIFSLINPYCLFPLFIVFFGSGETPKIAVLTWVSLWPIFFNSLAGLKNIDPILLKTAKSLSVGPFSTFSKIILPGSLPSIFNGIRLGVEMSFFILIAAEMTGATAGLGWIIHNAGALNQVNRIYGAGICVVVLGVLLNRFAIFIQNGLCFWKEELDPLTGVIGGDPKARFSTTKLTIVVAGFLLVLIVGAYEIITAERRLNDPTVIPEYRVWTE
ncbi:MAG: ABC transporter permease [Deltaproteobacteria bacterium]|jgi:NitT/TauT family transport system permease protein|nr:ABC transporter permease [Deltaproteobacteria bacterium]